MTFLAPWYLAAAVTAALGVVTLHLLARRRPPAVLFPTARFIPDVPARRASRTTRPSDRLLLALRALTVLLAGAALAGPVREPSRRPVTRVIAVDLSRGVRTPGEGVARAAALLRDGDAVVVFDSAARVLRAARADSLRSLLAAAAGASRVAGAAGSLSAALVAATRAAASVARAADSLELVLVSPLVEEEWDAATLGVRALWPGRITLVRTTAAEPSSAGAAEIRDQPDDPLRPAVALAARAPDVVSVRVVRGAPTGADSAWARDSSRVLVSWPAELQGAGWAPLPRPDTVGAVVAAGTAVVAPFARTVAPPAGRVTARWVDGRAAATERPLGDGCVRSVAVPVPTAGDLVLREGMRRFVMAVLEPCGGARRLAPLPDSLVRALAGEGGRSAARALTDTREGGSTLAPWLLGAALLLAAVEPLARSQRTGTRWEGGAE